LKRAEAASKAKLNKAFTILSLALESSRSLMPQHAAGARARDVHLT